MSFFPFFFSLDLINYGFLLIFVQRSKNLIEQIRTLVFASNRPQFIYTQQLYGFQTENESIEPLKLRTIYEQDEELELQRNSDDEIQPDIIFNHEWIHQKVNSNTAMEIVITRKQIFYLFIEIYVVARQCGGYHH